MKPQKHTRIGRPKTGISPSSILELAGQIYSIIVRLDLESSTSVFLKSAVSEAGTISQYTPTALTRGQNTHFLGHLVGVESNGPASGLHDILGTQSTQVNRLFGIGQGEIVTAHIDRRRERAVANRTRPRLWRDCVEHEHLSALETHNVTTRSDRRLVRQRAATVDIVAAEGNVHDGKWNGGAGENRVGEV